MKCTKVVAIKTTLFNRMQLIIALLLMVAFIGKASATLSIKDHIKYANTQAADDTTGQEDTDKKEEVKYTDELLTSLVNMTVLEKVPGYPLTNYPVHFYYRLNYRLRPNLAVPTPPPNI
jgi:hypothetical protein